jgi:acyl-coenzyme A thioesterase PaaI-like protein
MPISGDVKHAGGVICGQAIMSAIDMVVTLAMSSTDRAPKATVYQNNHFLRPATDDLRITATVLKFGKSTAYAEVSVTLAESGELVARAATEWAF